MRADTAPDRDRTIRWLPTLLLVASVVFLDLFPVTVLRRYLAGSTIRGGLAVLAYVFGGLLFGRYGIFIGPLVLVATPHVGSRWPVRPPGRRSSDSGGVGGPGSGCAAIVARAFRFDRRYRGRGRRLTVSRR